MRTVLAGFSSLLLAMLMAIPMGSAIADDDNGEPSPNPASTCLNTRDRILAPVP